MNPVVRIEDRGHGPVICINGRPTHIGGVGRASYRQELPSLIDAKVSSRCLLWPRAFFKVGEEPDIEALIEEYRTLLRSSPDGLLATVITLAPSQSWVESHPGEMTAYSPQVDPRANLNASRTPDPSWASLQWRRDSADFLRRVVASLHQALDGRIVLYYVGSGKCGENYPICDPVRYAQWYCSDFSEPMRRWFSSWLREKYGDVDALRRAWGDDQVTFDSAQVPSRESRLRSDWFSFRSPLRAQVSDYYKAWSEAIEINILEWATAIKDATHGAALTASAIGGVLDCGINTHTLLHVMRHGFRKCLQSPALDMFESPASYAFRDLGHGDTSAMIPLGSLSLHGKVWFRDLDSRTSRSGDPAKDPSSVLWRAPADVWQDEQMLKRDAGYSIVKGGAWWWHEIVRDMFSHPQHRAIVETIERVAHAAVELDHRAAPGLGVFVDPDSDYSLSNSNRLIFPMNYEARRRHWTRAGMACESYFLDDVAHPGLPDHRVLMVTNAFAITDAQVDAVKQRARQTGATLIWLVAPGIAGPAGFDTDRVSRIVGLPIKAMDVETQPTIRMLRGEHPWSSVPLPEGGQLDTFGVGPRGRDDSATYSFGPQFYADVESGGDVTVLGLNENIDRPGLVVRDGPEYRTVYCSAPYVHHALLHAIGRDSGAHQFAPPGCVLHASRQLLLIHASRSVQHRVCFPDEAEVVVDLFDRRLIGRAVREIDLELDRYETRLIYYGPERKGLYDA